MRRILVAFALVALLAVGLGAPNASAQYLGGYPGIGYGTGYGAYGGLGGYGYPGYGGYSAYGAMGGYPYGLAATAALTSPYGIGYGYPYGAGYPGAGYGATAYGCGAYGYGLGVGAPYC
jgi:hypothetical protein